LRAIDSIRYLALTPFYPGFPLRDRLRIAFYYLKSLVLRFVLWREGSGKRLSVSFDGTPLYFRDNRFDPRSLFTVFENDYTALDPCIFKGLSLFVDVGANLGLVSRCASHYSPGCRIICFEPLPGNAELCSLNNPSAKVERVAAGSKEGRREILVDDSGFMASSLDFGYGQKKVSFDVRSLDSLLEGVEGQIDLLKIDVEGMEEDVLKGASRTLGRTRKVVAEIHSDALLSSCSSILIGAGFREQGRKKLSARVYSVLWERSRKDL